MDWKMRETEERERVLLMVSKFDHCLGDLLYRVRIGELKMDIVAIVSNHPSEALRLGMIDGIPYNYLPVDKDSKTQQEARIKALGEEHGGTLIVLARYMPILSDDLEVYWSG